MKQFIILICLLTSLQLLAQSPFHIKAGIGMTSITTDVNSLNVIGGNIDGELIYNFQKPIAIGLSTSTGYGFSLNNEYGRILYQQENLNLYFRLFDNRVFVGGGISAAQIRNKTATVDVNNNPTNYETINQFLFGGNFTVCYKVGKIGQHHLYLQAYQQSYFPENMTGIGVLIGK